MGFSNAFRSLRKKTLLNKMLPKPSFDSLGRSTYTHAFGLSLIQTHVELILQPSTTLKMKDKN
jgi:hypothetical protein